MNTEMGNLLFSLEAGYVRKFLIFKKQRIIQIFEKGLYFKDGQGKSVIYISEIDNAFIRQSCVNNFEGNTFVIDFSGTYIIVEDNMFEGFTDKIRDVLSNEWKSIVQKKLDLPNTIKWINACCTTYLLDNNRDAGLFGGCVPLADRIPMFRKFLEDWWDIKNREDLISTIESLKNIDNIKSNQKLSWNLVRGMQLSFDGYFCDYFTYEEALNQCLSIAIDVQAHFSGWDDVTLNYIKGYADWRGESLEDKDSSVYYKKARFESLKETKESPYHIEWDTKLKQEW